MKSKVITSLLISGAFLLTACSSGSPEAPVITEAETAVLTETETVTSSEVTEEQNDITDTAVMLLEMLSEVDAVCSGAAELDLETTFDADEFFPHYKVTDTRFSDIAGLKEYITLYLTDECLDEKYGYCFTGESPRFIEKDGVLYSTECEGSCGYLWLTDELVIQDETDSSFTIICPFEDYDGLTPKLRINAVLDNGSWKIASYDHIS